MVHFTVFVSAPSLDVFYNVSLEVSLVRLLGCFLMVVFYNMRSRKWFVSLIG